MGSTSTREEEGNMISSDSEGQFVASAPCEYSRFRPQIYYQKVETWHIVDPSLDLKMNFATGENHARFSSDVNPDDNDDMDRMDQLLQSTTKLVTLPIDRNDEAAACSRLNAAASWGDDAMIGYIIRSCYVTERCALPALVASCSAGFDQCVAVLLRAGVRPTTPFVATGKNPFHYACENGQEQCAMLLINSMKCISEVYEACIISEGDEITAFELMRRNDMHGMARRLEATAVAKFANA